MAFTLPTHLLDRLAETLRQPLPGVQAQLRMVPEGRPMGDPSRYTEAAVLIAVHRRRGHWTIPLILRADDGYAHGGQVGLPGGRREHGESLAECAVREAEEEVALPAESVRLLGALTPLPVPVSRHIIHPFVAAIPDDTRFTPDHNEVQRIIPLDLETLLDPATRSVGEIVVRRASTDTADRLGATRTGDDLRLQGIPFYDILGHKVWGATAMILGEFHAVLEQTTASA